MLRTCAVLFLLLILPLRANLGDAVDQCVKRYGKPTGFSEAGAKSPFGTLVFVAGPYQLIVFLLDNVEVGARVSKVDKTDFTPAEMRTILDADATSPWTPGKGSDANTLQWNRADKATVLYDKDKKMLIFTSPQMLDALKHPPAQPTHAPPPPMVN